MTKHREKHEDRSSSSSESEEPSDEKLNSSSASEDDEDERPNEDDSSHGDRSDYSSHDDNDDASASESDGGADERSDETSSDGEAAQRSRRRQHDQDSLSSEESQSEEDDDEDDEAEDDEEQNSEDDDMPVALKLQRRLAAGAESHLQSVRKRQQEARFDSQQRLKAFLGEQKSDTDKSATNKKSKEATTKKNSAVKEKKSSSKHAPTEASSKRSDFFSKQNRRYNLNESGIGVTIASGYKPRDPRHQVGLGTSKASKGVGTTKADVASEQNYDFLLELRNKEMAQLKQRIRAHQMTGKKGQQMRRKLAMTHDIDKQPSLEDDRARLQQLKQDKAQWERRQIDRVAHDKVQQQLLVDPTSHRRRYVSRRKQKELLLEATYDEIRKRSGEHGVEKTLTKRLKRMKRKGLPLIGRA